MITPAEHAEALAWVRSEIARLLGFTFHNVERVRSLTFAEAILTRHFNDADATDALAFVKAVRG